MYQDVRGPDGRKLFRFDPERDLVEIRDRGTVYTVDLSQYRPQVEPAAVIEIDPLRDTTFDFWNNPIDAAYDDL